MADTLYNVVDEATGEVIGHVPASRVSTLPAGTRTAGIAEERRAALQQEEGSVGGQLATAAAATVHEATLGYGTTAMNELLPGYGQFYEGLSEINPVANVIGRGVGIGANIAMLGGPTLALEEQLASRGIGQVSRLALLGGVEGAVAGTGEGLARASIDNDLNGEKLLVSALTGMGLGTAFGFGIGGTFALIGKGARGLGGAIAKAADDPGKDAARRVLQDRFGYAPSPAVEWLSEKVADASSALSGKPRDLTRRALGASKESQRWRRLVAEADDIKPKLVDDMARHVDGFESASDEVSEAWRRTPLKREQVKARIRTDNLEQQVVAWQGKVEHLRSRLDDIERSTGKWSSVKELRRAMDDFTAKADSLATKGSEDLSTELYHSMDRLRIEWGKHAQAADRAAATRGTWKWQQRADILKDGYDNSLKPFLKDSELWGGAGDMQRAVADPLSEYMSAKGRFNSSFLTEGVTKSKSDPWRNAVVADRGKIERFIDGIINPGQDLNHQALRISIDSRVRAAQAMIEHGELTPAQRAASQRMVTEGRKLLGRVDDAMEVVTASNQARLLDGGAEGTGLLTGGLVGSMAGGPVGGIIGAVLGALRHPGRTSRQLGALEHFVSRYDQKQTKAMTKAFGLGVKLPGALTLTRTLRRGAEVGARTAEGKRTEYHARREALQQWNDNRDAHRYAMAKSMQLLHGEAPKAVTSALDGIDRANEYLLANLPATGKKPGPFQVAREPARSEIDSFLRRARAIEDPSTLLEDMAAGKLARDSVDAVKSVHPQLFSEMRMSAMQLAADMEADGKRLGWDKRLQLGTLLGIPTDGTLEPRFIATMQAMYAEQAALQERGGPNVSSEPAVKPLSDAYQTESQSMNEERT